MKNLKKITVGLVGVFSLGCVILSIGYARAQGTGQIESGNTIFQVRNLTKNGTYSDKITAKECDELVYSIRLHNTGFTTVNNVKIKVNINSNSNNSNTSKLSLSYSDGMASSASATNTIKFDSNQSIKYLSSSARYYDVNGNIISSPADGVTENGVDLGSINGSTTRFLNFHAKVSCPSDKTPAVITTTSTLPETGPGNIVAIFIAVTILSTASFSLLAHKFS